MNESRDIDLLLYELIKLCAQSRAVGLISNRPLSPSDLQMDGAQSVQVHEIPQGIDQTWSLDLSSFDLIVSLTSPPGSHDELIMRGLHGHQLLITQREPSAELESLNIASIKVTQDEGGSRFNYLEPDEERGDALSAWIVTKGALPDLQATQDELSRGELILPPEHYTDEEVRAFEHLNAKVIINPSDSTSRVVVDLEMKMSGGRHRRSDILIEEALVSRDHFIIFFYRGSMWIRDENSRSGTYLNEVKILKPQAVSHGDMIRVGRTELEISYGERYTLQRDVLRDVLLICHAEDELSHSHANMLPFHNSEWSFAKIPFGIDARDDCLAYVKRYRLVIVSLGLNLSSADHQYLEDPRGDFRLLLMSALKARPIIPVLFDDVELPSPEELPEELRDLSFRRPFSLKSDHSNLRDLIDITLQVQPVESARDEPSQAPRALPQAPVERDRDRAHQSPRGPLVFISFSSHDRQIAEELYHTLESQGVAVWCSIYDIEPGASWDQSINQALDVATHVALLVSAESASSRYVRSEIDYALSQDKTVMPIVINRYPLPIWWSTLQLVHYEDLRSDSSALRSFIGLLPLTDGSKLNHLVTQRAPLSEIKELILKNPHWLGGSHETSVFPSLNIAVDIAFSNSVLSPSEIDRSASVLPPMFNYAYVIMDPYMCPFNDRGEVHPTIAERLNLHDLEEITNNRHVIPFEARVVVQPKIVILIGLRDLCGEQITHQMREDWESIGVSFMSYTRLLKRLGGQ